MYSSPGTPPGTSCHASSRTYTRVFAMGVPMRMGAPPDGIRHHVDHTVVSVGPYMFQASRHDEASFDAISDGQASPPTSAFSRRSPGHFASNRRRHVAGVAWSTVARDRSSSARRAL